MESQDIQPFVESLSSLITKIQSNISNLDSTSDTMKSQLEGQQEKLNQLSDLDEKISISLDEYRASVSSHLEALNAQYEDFTKEQINNSQEIKDKIEAFQITLTSVKENMVSLGADLSQIPKDTYAKITAFMSRLEESFEALEESFEAWKTNSESLLDEFERTLVDLDRKISVKLDNAARTVSSKLDPTLRDIINALEAANARMKKVAMINYAMIIASSIAIVLALIF